MNNRATILYIVTILCITLLFVSAYMLGYYAAQYASRVTDMRVSSSVDALAVFENRLVQDDALLRERVQALRDADPTLESFTAYAPHGDEWRVYLADGGSGEGAVVAGDRDLFAPALKRPYESVVVPAYAGTEGDRTVVRALALGDIPQVLLVATYSLTDAERARERWVPVLWYVVLVGHALSLILVGCAVWFRARKRTEPVLPVPTTTPVVE